MPGFLKLGSRQAGPAHHLVLYFPVVSAWTWFVIGGLSSRSLVRLTLDGERVTDEERIKLGARIRNVRQGPDGAVYLLTDQDDGAILRLTPARGE
jgi:glucose/arabinose dehydrogenase